ncbi:MAG: AAA family ATPase [Candidatus Saccharibacteria bacterium]|nr:AAA family ATPase [Rhodoferax sp.]
MKHFIVVTGLPASGKSTLARAIASSLAIPLFDKDTLLEAQFENLPVPDAKTRKNLSQLADHEFRKLACKVDSAILVSWWKHPLSLVDSGTHTEWLTELPGKRTEVHCNCSANVAAERFLARKRHTGHLDNRWTRLELIENFTHQAALGPLGIGEVIELDTGSPTELVNLVDQVIKALAK